MIAADEARAPRVHLLSYAPAVFDAGTRLSAAGFEVQTATTVEGAGALGEPQDADVVVLDLTLRDLTFTSMVRLLGSRARPPLVLLLFAIKAIEGFPAPPRVAYLGHPFGAHDVVRAVHGLLDEELAG